jgi:hypothetical protein
MARIRRIDVPVIDCRLSRKTLDIQGPIVDRVGGRIERLIVAGHGPMLNG